jgi:hypothetical protein
MAGPAGGPRFALRIEEAWLAADLAHASAAARAESAPLIGRLRDGGVPVGWLRPCEAEARDGTRLPGCVKLYIPQPAGPWGAVFGIDREASKPALLLLAVGERHPGVPWRPSVYEIADRRLNG